MYTSGTTDQPTGITFTQENLITKRFARALALPAIGPQDTFLCYLPLYHTFGRFFELLGSLFWGATYTFAESPEFRTLLKDFKLTHPTIFISIPKRWIQLYEQIEQALSSAAASEREIEDKVKELTGGKLKCGLSAAGYLDPDIFQFFQRYGIQLLSGYGMTEATGGITMTPPGDYVRESVGKLLPGLDAQLAQDGELLLQGPYISPGYSGDHFPPILQEGWFHTGDIFKLQDGHYFLLDRKKEIYKNTRGQTIAPQRIENLFQDFEAIKSVFLVGDGREYNTLLIYPDPECKTVDLDHNTPQETREYFSSLVQSVNNFLATYERIVNFAIIPRDFSAEEGEVTPKGTYRRKTILEHFASVIEPMYQKNYLSLIHEQYEFQIPNWIVREMGLLRSHLTWDGHTLVQKSSQKRLRLHWENNTLQLGDFHYQFYGSVLNLNELLPSPELWLGNDSLVRFFESLLFRVTRFEPPEDIQLIERRLPFQPLEKPTKRRPGISKEKITLETLHEVAFQFLNKPEKRFKKLYDFINPLVEQEDHRFHALAITLLQRLCYHPSLQIRCDVLNYLLPSFSGEQFLERFIHWYDDACQQGTKYKLALDIHRFQTTHYKALLDYLDNLQKKYLNRSPSAKTMVKDIFTILVEYGRLHPTSYQAIRAALVRWSVLGPHAEYREAASKAARTLERYFRQWLGQPDDLAVDRETGEEYTWQDVLVFDKRIPPFLKKRLFAALTQTTLLREAVFLFHQRPLLHLQDLQRRGVWVGFLGEQHGKQVVRVLIKTRDLEAFNIVINYNHDLTSKALQTEIEWLIVMGASRPKLVESFGGYWPEHNLYTEEYVAGETVYQALERNREEIAAGKNRDRWQIRWLHYIWNGVMAYLDFWHHTNFQLMITDPTPKNLIIPEFDYATGTRLISISNRQPVENATEVLLTIYEQYIIKTEEAFPGLQKMAEWEVIFTALIQVLGEEKGIPVLEALRQAIDANPYRDWAKRLGVTTGQIESFLKEVEETGILPKQVVFAALRYERWLDLNPEATLQAKGTFLQELYHDYGLSTLAKTYPETRLRFFLLTAFKDAKPPVKDRLTALLIDWRRSLVTEDTLEQTLRELHEQVTLNEEETFFLTRLVYEHVEAADYAQLVAITAGERGRLDLVVLVEDSQGDRYRIRPPFIPKEVAHFHTLLAESNLHVTFHAHHEFLLVINLRGHVVGGVFWKPLNGTTAYLERVVIARHFRKRNLSTLLLEELFNRLRERGFTHLTVGFFQAELFYHHGFQIDEKFGGLVKKL
jgi:GNAT superfamily N-acetyltransferase